MSPCLTGGGCVEDVADGAADGVEVPEGHPGLADHGVQVVSDGVSVVSAGGAGAGHDAHDGSPSVERRGRREGRLHRRSGQGHHGVHRVGAGWTGDIGDRVVGGGGGGL